MRSPGFLLVLKKNPMAESVASLLPRLALVASRKTGNAVRRNALRRRFRENFRLFPNDNLRNWDFLIVFLPESKGLSIHTMGENFRNLLQKIAKGKGEQSPAGR
jgi:ribonuclease P protein component